VMQLGYVSIGASDTVAWRDFAEKFLAVEASFAGEVGGDLLLRMDDRRLRYLIRPTGEDDIREIGWEVADSVELAGIRDRFVERGIPLLEGEFDTASLLAPDEFLVFEDPAGVRGVVYTAPLAAQGPVRLQRGHQGFVTGDFGAGHVVMLVEPYTEVLDFYTNVLGFRVSDYMRNEQVRSCFLHCNPRHHSLAIAGLKSPKLLNHIMLECRALEDVGIAMDEAKKNGMPITGELGKHANDLMTSFYVNSPSGFEIEYGWGGRIIDDETWTTASYGPGNQQIWGHARQKAHESVVK
ncbi:VOC family protein, partial [Microbacterium sp. X-17]|uniref:VOC family protein n=1 Tax=Microbacterium sp. X-17 TaxID=3144404 RepID=UPI0031F4B196